MPRKNKKNSKAKVKSVSSKKITVRKRSSAKKKLKKVIKKIKRTRLSRAVAKHKKHGKQAQRNRKKKVSMDDIYPIINKVQVGKKTVTFTTVLIDSATVENTIKDAAVKYKKVTMKTQVVFTLYPSDFEDNDLDILDKMEFLDDEIPEWGQIFG